MSLQLLKNDRIQKPVIVDTPDERDEDVFSRIRCPLCRWQPTASSVWACFSLGTPEPFFGGCGTVWNTFATGGLCPGCHHQWQWTSCLRCEQWSPHVDWYETSEHEDRD